jgi:hypothetical protein
MQKKTDYAKLNFSQVLRGALRKQNVIKKIFFHLILIFPYFFFNSSLFAQQLVRFACLPIDTIYDESIASVQLYNAKDPLSTPIIELGVGTLHLNFDDLSADNRTLLYAIEQRNADWSPSALEPHEYFTGFEGERIYTFSAAFNTNIPFIKYSLDFPNQYFSFTKSGNYLLKIFESGRDKKLILTRRLVVVEPRVQFITALYGSSVASRFRTHQEFDIGFGLRSLRAVNPMRELQITVLQNGRWDNSISTPPQVIIGDSVVLDYQDKITFAAGREFRQIDLRSVRFRSPFVRRIERGEETWELYMMPEKTRKNEPYFLMPDVNGRFVIASSDPPNEPDYVNAHVFLQTQEALEGAEIYVVGGFSDWQLRAEYKMEFLEGSNNMNGYHAQLFLKQGVYNYIYAIKWKNQPTPDQETLEGNWFETENEYTILIYHRPFGGRYDQVVGYKIFKCNGR